MEQQTDAFIPDGMNAFQRNVKRIGDCLIAFIALIIFSLSLSVGLSSNEQGIFVDNSIQMELSAGNLMKSINFHQLKLYVMMDLW